MPGESNRAHAAAVEGLRWVPPEDRTRPSTLEMQLSVPAETTTVRVSVNFEKAFLRLNEFPPDASRGFDLPSALVSLPPPKVLIFDRNIEGKPPLASPLLDAMERLRGGGSERVYVGGPLLTLPTPDFSMPFNVITMVSPPRSRCCREVSRHAHQASGVGRIRGGETKAKEEARRVGEGGEGEGPGRAVTVSRRVRGIYSRGTIR